MGHLVQGRLCWPVQLLIIQTAHLFVCQDLNLYRSSLEKVQEHIQSLCRIFKWDLSVLLPNDESQFLLFSAVTLLFFY